MVISVLFYTELRLILFYAYLLTVIDIDILKTYILHSISLIRCGQNKCLPLLLILTHTSFIPNTPIRIKRTMVIFIFFHFNGYLCLV